MTIDTIMFDWSGTLSDDFDCVFNAINGVLSEYGHEPIISRYLRENYQKDYINMYRKLGVTDSRENIDRYYKKHFSNQNKRPVPIKGAELVLKQLSQLEIELILLSSHPQEFIEQEVREYGFADFFWAGNVYGGVAEKSEIIKKVRPNPEGALMVGDTWVDMEAGQKAGVITVGILGGYNNRGLLELDADHIVGDLNDFLALVRKMNFP